MDCPYINDNHPLCSACLNINNLCEAFDLCANHYTLCPLYIQLSREKPETQALAAADIASHSVS